MIYRVNAFTEHISGGNPAGVVLDADDYSEQKMLDTAKEVGYSETAFVMKSTKANFKIRYFTPSDEVDLCGHATIATFTVLYEVEHLKAGAYTIETKAGVLPITVKKDGTILMNQLTPSFYENVSRSRIAKSLGLMEDQIITTPQVTSTGLKDIMVHVSDSKALADISPDFQMITEISRDHKATGYHVFTLDSKKTARCRNFAPLYAIDEESATGTASGAVSGYIIKHDLVKVSEGINHFIYEQGIEMDRPSEIHGYITLKNNTITEVIIGGKGKIQQN